MKADVCNMSMIFTVSAVTLLTIQTVCSASFSNVEKDTSKRNIWWTKRNFDRSLGIGVRELAKCEQTSKTFECYVMECVEPFVACSANEQDMSSCIQMHRACGTKCSILSEASDK